MSSNPDIVFIDNSSDHHSDDGWHDHAGHDAGVKKCIPSIAIISARIIRFFHSRRLMETGTSDYFLYIQRRHPHPHVRPDQLRPH
jgi:hypothetical protein